MMTMSTPLSNPVIAQIAKYLRGRHESITVSHPDIYTDSIGRKTPRHLQPVMLVRHVGKGGVGLSPQQYPRDYLTNLGLSEFYLRSNIVLHVFLPIVDSASGVVNLNEFQSDLLSGRDGDVRVDEDRYPNAKWKEIARNYCVIGHCLGDKKEEPESDRGCILSEVLSSARMDEYLTSSGFNHRDYEHLGDLDVGNATEEQVQTEDKIPDDAQSSHSVRHSQQSEDEKELELYERIQDHLAEAIIKKKAALKLTEKSSAKSSSSSFSSLSESRVHAGSSPMSLHDASSMSAEYDIRPYTRRDAYTRTQQNEKQNKRVSMPRPMHAQDSPRRTDDNWRRSTPL